MIADGWTGFFLFLLLVAPGLVYGLTSRQWRVPWKESSFTEASRVALASIAFSTVGIVAVVAAWRLFPLLRFDIDRFLLDEEYRVQSAGRGLTLVVVSTALACAAAWAWSARDHRKADKSGQALRLTADPAWVTAFRTAAPPGHNAYVKVALLNGAAWLGWVATYTAEFENSRAMILAGPLAYREAGESLAKNLDPKWDRVVIEAEQIAWISVQYRMMED